MSASKCRLQADDDARSDRLFRLQQQSYRREALVKAKNAQISRRLTYDLHKLDRNREISVEYCARQCRVLQREATQIRSSTGVLQKKARLPNIWEREQIIVCQRCRERDKRAVWRQIWEHYDNLRKTSANLVSTRVSLT
ncbi:hypothetical protein CAPTEDRAFT_204509 [Capitella teleta]|uniref:Uncharacterized protein n=1 Tax=Capitella teleta TaxID=283909 RepID=R7TWT2_CAPTE|nr:hypothetical protein CAPTEDRAFT_204509 [Capitella teleta]|eukprot:ELT98353.1 hypothetical protein CAPTEDRAFT_204509 [Capitella teleta]